MVITRKRTNQLKNIDSSAACLPSETTLGDDSSISQDNNEIQQKKDIKKSNTASNLKTTSRNKQKNSNTSSCQAKGMANKVEPNSRKERKSKIKGSEKESVESDAEETVAESEGSGDSSDDYTNNSASCKLNGITESKSRSRRSKWTSTQVSTTKVGSGTITEPCYKSTSARKRLYQKNRAVQESEDDLVEHNSGPKKTKKYNSEDSSNASAECDIQNLPKNVSDKFSKLKNKSSKEKQEGHPLNTRQSLKRSCNDERLDNESQESVVRSDKPVTGKIKKVLKTCLEPEDGDKNSVKKLAKKESIKSDSESESDWVEEEVSESGSDWEDQKEAKLLPSQKNRYKKQEVVPESSESDSDSGYKRNSKRVKKGFAFPKTKKRSSATVGKPMKLSDSESEEEIPNVKLSQHILEKVKMEPVRKHVFSYNDKIQAKRDIAEIRFSGDLQADSVAEVENPKLALKTRLPDIKPILKYFGPYFPLGEASTSAARSSCQLPINDESQTSADSVESEINTNSSKSSNSSKNRDKGDPGKPVQLSKLKKYVKSEEKNSVPATSQSSQNGSEESSSEESEWEEVSDADQQVMTLEDYNPEIPKEGIKITIGVPDPKKHRRKKRQEEFATYARRHINRFKKDTQIAMHKVHLLGFIAHSLYLNNNVLNDSTLQGMMLSLLPKDFLGITTKKTTSTLLKKMIEWFRETFVLEKKEYQCEILSSLLAGATTKTVNRPDHYCYLFIVMGRMMKLDVRLCKSIYPISFKPSDLLKTKIQRVKCVDLTKDLSKVETEETLKSSSSKCRTVKKEETKDEAAVKTTTPTQSSKKAKPKKAPKKEIKTEKTNSEKKPKRGSKTVVKYNDDQSELSEPESDIDFKPETKKRVKSQSSSSMKKNRKVLSSDSEGEVQAPNKHGINIWAEVFLNAEKKWVSVDVVKNIVSRPNEIEANTSYPISHVLVIDNDSRIKDVTQRYASSWLTQVRKERIDPDWWEESLEPFAPAKDKKDKDEDQQLNAMLMDQPFPTKIGDFKNHPLYVLQRHLLKFECLYPPEPATLGFIRKEPIYARECVHNLHSRDTWLKQGRGVKLGEKPYKIVKARPKWDKVNQKIITDLPLDVFGEWQTEPYVAPPCKDGKVPRNEYGNIEIFQPSMLPKGGVHLQLPGLSRVARKLGIDCAPALVGFEGNGWAGCLPVFDGFVVCEEFKEVLIAAWDEEQINIARREKEKRDKRVYGNWRKLIRGLLIREKIKSKYFGADEKVKVDPEKCLK